ncbi:uncharacterized protein LAESUDRAFT_721130 [Laetiporus sulphureus 93-53]|uniref:Glycosyltransferase family 23 protein n=1 Tax=Laetiporus sulphureus 93-53 TaxID=1314785 RepID=A0A165GSN0_9APHY|nr:uncharacterized protein LAESUDRAFT_721130 [Laetiporus sulphureus 93-53]KZT10756.1 hypothetical protein LAESUDRAFT_721130 [Laetiporus sulphureus 93-53]
MTAVGLWLLLLLTGYLHIPTPILRIMTKESKLPPLYSRYHQHELQMPQHNLSQADVQGTKYLWISNYIRGNGWGNVMQELLLNSYLAYRANRSFVFTNYTWTEGGPDFALYNLRPIPARIPLTALLGGPTVGAPMLAAPDAPLAVTKEFWDEVCPHATVIKDDDVVTSVDGSPTTAGMKVEKWLEKLRTTEDRCVEVPRDSWSIFDIWILQDAKRLLDEWPPFSHSPILTEFAWSPLIELAFDMNRETISPSSPLQPYLSSVPLTVKSAERYARIPGLLAIHVRRGDFVRHCKRLAQWEANYVAYNAFPSMPDQQDFPPNTPAPARTEMYRARCYPEIDEIVRRIEEIRNSEAGQGLQNIYIMTNAPPDWIYDLKAALRRSWGWADIASSRDLLLNQEQGYVKQAIDMLIGQRAQVFIGNPFSSLSGQVNMLRMANGFSPESCRLW